jgi:hypothetical protein
MLQIRQSAAPPNTCRWPMAPNAADSAISGAAEHLPMADGSKW